MYSLLKYGKYLDIIFIISTINCFSILRFCESTRFLLLLANSVFVYDLKEMLTRFCTAVAMLHNRSLGLLVISLFPNCRLQYTVSAKDNFKIYGIIIINYTINIIYFIYHQYIYNHQLCKQGQ